MTNSQRCCEAWIMPRVALKSPLVLVGETSQPTCLIGVARLCLKAVESRVYNPANWPAADVELNNLSSRNSSWPSRSPVPGRVMTHCQPAACRGRGEKRSREKRSFLPIRAHGKFIEASATRARLPPTGFQILQRHPADSTSSQPCRET